MNKRLKTFLYGILGVLVGISIVSIIKDGGINWSEIGYTLGMAFIILLFILGLNLYKKEK